MGKRLFWLSDKQWARIKPYLPTDVRGVERVDDRRVISGCACAQERLPLVRLSGSLRPVHDVSPANGRSADMQRTMHLIPILLTRGEAHVSPSA
jgi:hypothetical protein